MIALARHSLGQSMYSMCLPGLLLTFEMQLMFKGGDEMITKKWRIENGIGHWEVSNGNKTISCDDNELMETIRELLSK